MPIDTFVFDQAFHKKNAGASSFPFYDIILIPYSGKTGLPYCTAVPSG